MNKGGCLLFLFIACIVCIAKADDGYRKSGDVKLAQDSNDIDRKYLVSGDFNGDGYLDNAYAGVYGEDQWRLIVHLDVLSEHGEIIVLDQHTPDVPIEEVRLETRPAGKYMTVCGQAPEACEPNSPLSFTMQSDGIYLWVIEASASLIYWDNSSGQFVRQWLVD